MRLYQSTITLVNALGTDVQTVASLTSASSKPEALGISTTEATAKYPSYRVAASCVLDVTDSVTAWVEKHSI